MSGLLRASAGLVVGLALLLHGGELWAQARPFPPVYEPAPNPEPAKAPIVVLPKLKRFVEAAYPQEALDQGLGARVELELLIGSDGSVKEAKVVTPAGHGFDEAALEAARKFEFEPASRNGEPIAARVRYPYVFELKPAPPPEPEAAPAPAKLEGQVLAADDQQPLVGADVTVTSPDGAAVAHQTTDAQGRFAFDGLAAGTYQVHVQAKDREPSDQQEELHAGEATSVTYRLAQPTDKEAFGATARIKAPPREVTRRTISKEELTRIPGTRGDALRAVELMPGVARPPGGLGVLIVRGSAPGDTEFLFEGLPVQLIYHFGGLTSFINSRLIESIDFYPGNFGVRYGRHRGGELEIRAAELPQGKTQGVADLNFVDGSVLVIAPLGKDAEFALAGRKSVIDAFLTPVLKSQDVSTIAAPVYYDYQGILSYRPSSRDKLRLMLYGSSDHFKVLFPPSDSDALVDSFNLATQFHRVHASWRRQLSDDVEQDIDVGVGSLNAQIGIGKALSADLTGAQIYQRAEWRGRVNDHVRMIAGLDTLFFPGTFSYTGSTQVQSEGSPDANGGGTTSSNRNLITVRDSLQIVQPAIYVESDIDFAPWRFILGSRADYFSEIRGYSYDPRAAVHYALTENTSLKAGAGLFSQPPLFQESSAKLGNPHLKPSPTLHFDLGVDHQIEEGITVGAEGFYKQLFRNVVGTPFGQAPYLTNEGRGRIYGLEVSAHVNPRGRFFGYLSYTLSRSERLDHSGGAWRLFDFDQTHILTVAAVYRLGRGWETGATLRLYSGNPLTPVAGSSLNTGTGQYSPIYGLLNSGRGPMYNRVDVRIEKQWTFTDWKLALYLDIQNVYNATNSDGVLYDYEYRQKQNLAGFPPFLPVLGMRGEL